MKRIITTLFLLLCSITLNAQIKTWLGPDGVWSDANKWLPAGVPDNTSDVIIPSGTTLDINDNAQANSITVNAGATVDISANLGLFDNSIFAAGSIIDLVAGDISFTPGVILTVTGMLNVTSGFDKGIYGAGTLDVTGPGTINFDDLGGTFGIGGSAGLKISPTGVMNMAGDMDFEIPLFSAIGIINEGIINKTGGTGLSNVDVPYLCTNGTLNIVSGTMNFSRGDIINAATYNIGDGAEIIWSNIGKTIQGELNGVLDGPLSMSCTVSILDGELASFDFTGSDQVHWSNMARSFPGVLYNYSTINVNGPSNIVECTLINHGVVNINTEDGITMTGSGSVLDNQEDGVININNETIISVVFGAGNINNYGSINFQMGMGLAVVNPNVNTYPTGVIDIGADTVNFTGTFINEGDFTGNGSFALSNLNSVLGGNFYPGGGQVGSLDHIATIFNLYMDDQTVYHVDINGTAPETEHDVFNVIYNVALDGTFDINLGFMPQIGDEFVVMTFSDTLSSSLPNTVESIYDNNILTFDVVITDSTVTLKLVDILAGVDVEELEAIFPNLTIGPNPSRGPISIEFGEIIKDGNVKVYDMNGRLISNTTVQGVDKMILEIEDNAGNYLMYFKSGEKQASYLLMKY